MGGITNNIQNVQQQLTAYDTNRTDVTANALASAFARLRESMETSNITNQEKASLEQLGGRVQAMAQDFDQPDTVLNEAFQLAIKINEVSTPMLGGGVQGSYFAPVSSSSAPGSSSVDLPSVQNKINDLGNILIEGTPSRQSIESIAGDIRAIYKNSVVNAFVSQQQGDESAQYALIQETIGNLQSISELNPQASSMIQEVTSQLLSEEERASFWQEKNAAMQPFAEGVSEEGIGPKLNQSLTALQTRMQNEGISIEEVRSIAEVIRQSYIDYVIPQYTSFSEGVQGTTGQALFAATNRLFGLIDLFAKGNEDRYYKFLNLFQEKLSEGSLEKLWRQKSTSPEVQRSVKVEEKLEQLDKAIADCESYLRLQENAGNVEGQLSLLQETIVNVYQELFVQHYGSQELAHQSQEMQQFQERLKNSSSMKVLRAICQAFGKEDKLNGLLQSLESEKGIFWALWRTKEIKQRMSSSVPSSSNNSTPIAMGDIQIEEKESPKEKKTKISSHSIEDFVSNMNQPLADRIQSLMKTYGKYSIYQVSSKEEAKALLLLTVKPSPLGNILTHMMRDSALSQDHKSIITEVSKKLRASWNANDWMENKELLSKFASLLNGIIGSNTIGTAAPYRTLGVAIAEEGAPANKLYQGVIFSLGDDWVVGT